MSTHQVTTKTATRVLTDEVRASPVDLYLERLHLRLFWILLFIVVALLII